MTQEGDLDEFLNNAQLAGTNFAAGTYNLSWLCDIITYDYGYASERRNVKIIQQTAGSIHNPYLLTDQEEISTIKRHLDNRQRLRVPRRPPWTKEMHMSQLDAQEKRAFLEWRRGLAEYVRYTFNVHQS